MGFARGENTVPLVIGYPKMTWVFGFLAAEDGGGSTNFLRENGEGVKR